MSKFKVTVVERRTTFKTKVFEAASRDDAQHLAEADDSWSELDGWKHAGSRAGESEVDSIVLQPEGK